MHLIFFYRFDRLYFNLGIADTKMTLLTNFRKLKLPKLITIIKIIFFSKSQLYIYVFKFKFYIQGIKIKTKKNVKHLFI